MIPKRNILLAALLAAAMLPGAALAKVKAKSPAGEKLVYGNGSYQLYGDRIEEGADTAYAYTKGEWLGLKNARGEVVRPFLRWPRPVLDTGTPMLDSLYHIALCDFEMNKVDGHFRVSPDFHFNMFFTRDIAYSSLLGANYAFAADIKSHLRECRELRRKVGFTTGTGQRIPIDSVTPLETVEPLDNSEFFEKYSTHPYARRTDDICWVVGYWEAMKVQLDPGELEWFAKEFEYFDNTFYRHFLDASDGLYFGQATFVDIGGTGYPEEFSAQDAIMVKALSTNTVYYAALRIMEEAYLLLGQDGRAGSVAGRAERLGQAILREFRMPDGHYAYFKHRDGHLEPRRDQLGSAFLVWFGLLGPDQAGAAVGDYPGNDFGAPLFTPFYPGDRVYHNNSIWPFANTIFDYARFKAEPDEDLLLRTLGGLSRHALQGNFNEVMDYATGGRQFLHARSYTWSAAAGMAVAYRFIFGLDVVDFSRLVVRPCVPEALGNRISLDGLVVQSTRIRIELKGHGSVPAEITLDGKPAATAEVPLDGQEHTLAIKLAPAPTQP